MGDPSNLCCKTFNMVFLPFQHILRDKQGKRAVPDAQLFDLDIEPLLDFFPNKVGCGLNHINKKSL